MSSMSASDRKLLKANISSVFFVFLEPNTVPGTCLLKGWKMTRKQMHSSNASEVPKEDTFLLLKAPNTLRKGLDLNSEDKGQNLTAS